MSHSFESKGIYLLTLLFALTLLCLAALPTLMVYRNLPLFHRAVAVLALATVLSFAPRAMLAARFETTWLGAVPHPLAVAIFVAVQWRAFIGQQLGRRPVSCRGRLA